jgi:hypothetical protein
MISEPGATSVSYRMTPAELLRASRTLSPSLHYYSLLRQIVAYLSLAAVITLSSCLLSRLVFHDCDFHFWIPFALIFLVFSLDAWLVRRHLAQREARSPAFGPHRMSISAEELVDQTPVTRHVYQWKGIERIVVDPDFIYVVVDYPLLYMKSRRSFSDDDEANQFAKLLLAHHQTALSQNK